MATSKKVCGACMWALLFESGSFHKISPKQKWFGVQVGGGSARLDLGLDSSLKPGVGGIEVRYLICEMVSIHTIFNQHATRL